MSIQHPVNGGYDTDSTMPLRLYSLGADFSIVKMVEVQTTQDAAAVVADHLVGTGYTNLRTVNDGDGSLRFIADPPKGRKGRNVAALDF